MKSTHRWIMILTLVLSMWSITACGTPRGASPTEITVLTAASLSDVMKELERKYESAHPQVDLVPSFASSGKLKQQIEQGAPADLFLSASSKEMDDLLRKGLIDSKFHADLVSNELVLIIPKDSPCPIKGWSDLTSAAVNKLSIGQPETVPAGRYAKQTLEHLHLWKQLQPKMIFAGDVRQVLAHVKSGNADAGIVYLTDAATTDGITVAGVANPQTHPPIVYPIGVIKATKQPKQTQDFYHWLQGPEASFLFSKYGFKKAP
ncbi:molybdate ABC transporter substrate-binding protein [Laceyella putida]|uniref:Molybdate ABC transporter substrate-binding protein n=1 Tax=Laceyella putida TaxID=110101 RepID=A0ABW2RFS5_9BACL